jgi:maleamate amidohydrolase
MTGLPASYDASGLGGELGFGVRPAVVVVDLTLGFTDLACPLASDLDAEVAATRELLAAARAHDVSVVFLAMTIRADGFDGGVFVRKCPPLRMLTAGSRWTEIDPRLDPRPGEVVLPKTGASGFTGTPLKTLLTTWGVDTVLVTGATTSGCVRATVVDACMAGFIPVVVREAVGDRDPDQHRASLIDMAGKYADVRSLAEVLAYVEALAVPSENVYSNPLSG